MPKETIQQNKKVAKKKTGKIIYKKALYEVYKTWGALPAIWKGLGPKKITELGIDDLETIELISVKTQREFARKFGLSEETLSAWNKLIEKEGADPLEESRKVMQKFLKNVVGAHYRKAVRRFDPMTGELFYQLFGGWNPKKIIKHEGKLSILELSKKIADDESGSAKNNKENSE